MALVAGIGENPLELVADHLFDIGNDGRECVPVIGITGQRLGMDCKLAALGALERRRD